MHVPSQEREVPYDTQRAICGQVHQSPTQTDLPAGAARRRGAAVQALPTLPRRSPLIRPGLSAARAPFRLLFYAPPWLCDGWGYIDEQGGRHDTR
jgi:hypothetical protein